MRGASHDPIRGNPNRVERRNNEHCIRHGQVIQMAGDATAQHFTISLPSICHNSNIPVHIPGPISVGCRHLGNQRVTPSLSSRTGVDDVSGLQGPTREIWEDLATSSATTTSTLPGKPNLFERRPQAAAHSNHLNPTPLGTTFRAHGEAGAHLCVRQSAAGCFRQRFEHRRRHLRRRCSSIPSQVHILPAAIDTQATSCDQTGKTRSRCVLCVRLRACRVRDALTCLLCTQLLLWSKMGPHMRVLWPRPAIFGVLVGKWSSAARYSCL